METERTNGLKATQQINFRQDTGAYNFESAGGCGHQILGASNNVESLGMVGNRNECVALNVSLAILTLVKTQHVGNELFPFGVRVTHSRTLCVKL